MRKTVQLGATIATIAFLALPSVALATGDLNFSAGPLTGAPPAILGPYAMHAFPTDPTPAATLRQGVKGPTGEVFFDQEVGHDLVPTNWGSWSNGYMSDVYQWLSAPNELTLSPPLGTSAFYFYAEPDNTGPFAFTATARDGNPSDTTSSGPVSISGSAGAKYFGFYTTNGAAIRAITISTESGSGGFAVGEFGIATNLSPSAITGPTSNLTTSTAHLTGVIDPMGVQTSYRFEYGTTVQYTQSTPASPQSAGSGTADQPISVDLGGLSPGTTYHYRITAIGLFGAQTSGEDATFTTVALPPPPPEAKLSLGGSPSATTSGVTLTAICAGATCSGKATLTAIELVKSKKVSGVSAKTKTQRETVVVGTASFSIQAGATKKVTVALNATGRKLLAKFKKLSVALTIAYSGSGGKQIVLPTAHLTISPPKKKH